MADNQRQRESLYPKRIAGISFSEVVYDGVQDARARHDLSDAQLIRGTVAKGLGAYTGDLHTRIEQAAAELGTTDSEVVRGALEKGLEEFVFMERGRKFHERNAGKQLSERVVRRLLMNMDELYTEDEKEQIRREHAGMVLRQPELFKIPGVFCDTCGQYVRSDERGSEWDKRLVAFVKSGKRT